MPLKHPPMKPLENNPTREEVLRYISASASYGNLGLFVGTGFSKAILNDGVNDVALSWGELLRQSAMQLQVDFEAILKEGSSYPEIASCICQKYADLKKITFSQGVRRLKGIIARLTSCYPDREKSKQFGAYLDALSPAWVITTNYDLVIETILTGRSIPLGPNDLLTNPRGIVPVYHLHGVRTDPEEIIITQEDYVSLFRPNEYRQIKLALTIKESTTLLIGYGLGDVNVLTALDWSSNVFKGEKRDFPQGVIQVHRKNNHEIVPYRDRNEILVIEASDLVGFFEEYMIIRSEEEKKENDERKKLLELSKQLADSEDNLVEKFIDNRGHRRDVIQIISRFPIPLVSGFILLLEKCIDETWKRSEPKGQFEGYNQNLLIILDILTLFDVDNLPPALFQMAAYGLERVGDFVGNKGGQSWSAARTWERRKGELSREMVIELRDVAVQHDYPSVIRLLEGM